MKKHHLIFLLPVTFFFIACNAHQGALGFDDEPADNSVVEGVDEQEMDALSHLADNGLPSATGFCPKSPKVPFRKVNPSALVSKLYKKAFGTKTKAEALDNVSHIADSGRSAPANRFSKTVKDMWAQAKRPFKKWLLRGRKSPILEEEVQPDISAFSYESEDLDIVEVFGMTREELLVALRDYEEQERNRQQQGAGNNDQPVVAEGQEDNAQPQRGVAQRQRRLAVIGQGLRERRLRRQQQRRNAMALKPLLPEKES